MNLSRSLHHVIVESRHVRESPFSEVSPGFLEHVTPLLLAAIETGQPVPLSPFDWMIKAREVTGDPSHADALKVDLYYGPADVDGPPHIAVTVIAAVPNPAAQPICLAATAGLVRLLEDPDPRKGTAAFAAASMDAGDLERDLAWAWLIHRGDVNHDAPAAD